MRDNIEVSGPQKVTVANAIGRWGGRGRQGPPGPPGERGPRGFPGPPGESGGFAHYGTEPPADPEAGQFWFDTSTEPPILKFWTGDDWQALEAEAAIPDPLTLAQFIATSSFRLNSASGPTLTSGTAAPNVAQPAGSLYLRTGAATTAGQRLYWNQNGTAGGWIAIDNQPGSVPDPLTLSRLVADVISPNLSHGGTLELGSGDPSESISIEAYAHLEAPSQFNANATFRAELLAQYLLRLGSTTGPTVRSGAAAPSDAQPAGSLYLRTGTPTVPGQRLYWNQDGTAGGWVAIDDQGGGGGGIPITTGPPAAPGAAAGEVQADTQGGLWVWDGTYWRPVGGQQYFTEVQQSTPQSIPNNTWASVTFDTVLRDPASGWSVTNWNWTAPIPGRYLVDANVAIQTTNLALLRLRRANVSNLINGFGPASNLWTTATLSGLITINNPAADWVILQILQNSGAAVNTDAGPQCNLHFSYLGPL